MKTITKIEWEQMPSENLLSMFHMFVGDLRKKEVIKSKVQFEYLHKSLSDVGTVLIKRDVMTFVEYQNERKKLRGYEKRYGFNPPAPSEFELLNMG